MQKQVWSDQFIKHMIAKGSLVPPPHSHVPRWYWPGAITAVLVAMLAAFFWGVYGP
jgi:hypothetical protein